MQRRETRQDQTGMQLDLFRGPFPSGANLTSEVFKGNRNGSMNLSPWAKPADRRGAKQKARCKC